MHPPYWGKFLSDHSLLGRIIKIPEHADVSGLGADLQIFSVEQSKEEAEALYPGIAVAPDGFVPVAQCLVGSGDPYFINTTDGDGGPLYRIYHDAVAQVPYDRVQAVAVVLHDYRLLLRYADA